jgi:hypothetical protein
VFLLSGFCLICGFFWFYIMIDGLLLVIVGYLLGVRPKSSKRIFDFLCF